MNISVKLKDGLSKMVIEAHHKMIVNGVSKEEIDLFLHDIRNTEGNESKLLKMKEYVTVEE